MSSESTGETLIREAYRLAELNLESETQMLLASDQRATTFCGILIAAIAFSASDDPMDESIFDNLSIVFLAFSAALAAYSARSIKVFTTGLRFDSFAEDISQNRGFRETIFELSQKYDECSTHNRNQIKFNAKIFNYSLILAVVGFMIAVVPHVGQVMFAVSDGMKALVGGPS